MVKKRSCSGSGGGGGGEGTPRPPATPLRTTRGASREVSRTPCEPMEVEPGLTEEAAPCISRDERQANDTKPPLNRRELRSLRGFTSDLSGLNVDFSDLAGQVERAGPDGDMRWGEESDVPEDVYGVAIVTIAKDITELIMRLRIGAPLKLSLIRIGVALAMMAVNLVLQFGLVHYTRFYIANSSVRLVQSHFKHFRAHVYDVTGEVNSAKWQQYPFQDEICSIAMTERVFCYTILFLWTLTILNEVRTAQRIYTTVSSLPRCTLASDMLAFQDCIQFEGRCCIVGLTRLARIALYLLVLLPKFAISFFLLHIGSRWLISGTFSDMILNSLALGFVIEIDDLLFMTVLPHGMQNQVRNTKFFVAEPKVQHLHEVDKRHIQGYKRTGCYMFFGLAYLFIYMRYMQSVLPPDLEEVRKLCFGYLEKAQSPLCRKLGVFDATNAQQCYPFGIETE
mmetsp:Transcript_41531/g.104357  ORF Transcript_41531/g.104357 Transcript_41531/m.104357 type:complete len:452 (+) Transcript_41531:707-2062(+)